MFEIHEQEPEIDPPVVDAPETGTGRLASAVATTGWLAAGMLHDFRNPLGTIRSASEILLDVDVNAAQLKRLARNMHNAATRMQELLTELTNSLRGDLAPAEIGSLRQIILDSCQVARAAPHVHVRVLVDVPGEIRLPLRPSCIQRVFVNLLHNSFEAMPGGGNVTIAARRSGEHVLIDFQDSGPGIPPAIRDSLFQPFVTAEKPRGLGLGLALARQTILSHGGSMSLAAGKGAHFVISLPGAETPHKLA